MRILALGLCVLKHPIYAFNLIKSNRGRSILIPSVFLLLLAVAVRISSIFIVHFPVTDIQLQEVSILFEILLVIVPVIAWSVSLFGITSILDGETHMGEAFTATVFSLIPYILFTLPIAWFTNLLGFEDRIVYTILTWMVISMVAFLLVTNVKVMNTYSMPKTLLVMLLTFITMWLFLGILFLLYALSNQFIQFVVGLFRELNYFLRD